MLIFIALLYFCIVCGIIGLVFFPTAREQMLLTVRALEHRVELKLGHWQLNSARHRGQWRRAWRGVRRATLSYLRRHRAMFAICVPLVLIPSLLALVMRSPGALPDYETGERIPDEQVAALLKGEQLVPPVALPPLLFSLPEVELVRPMLADASRNWGLLHPEFSQRLLLAFKIMKEKYGYEMALLEGYRSPARQDMLAKMGSNVTNARAFQSWHQYGLAADCAFLRQGRLVISERDPWAMRGYQLYGKVAESLGLTWGGRWTMMDFGHTELRLRGVVQP
jgi:peptidoglycan L-alanyl-D-glutamate endopeptidase CwlK